MGKKVVLESGNYLKISLKKMCVKNETNSSYIYKTCFFLHDTHTHMNAIESKRANFSQPNCPFGEEYVFKSSFGNSFEDCKENNFSNTFTNQNQKTPYSSCKNCYLFKYLIFNNQNLLSDLLLDKPLLFKKAIEYIDWLISNYGQTKP